MYHRFDRGKNYIQEENDITKPCFFTVADKNPVQFADPHRHVDFGTILFLEYML